MTTADAAATVAQRGYSANAQAALDKVALSLLDNHARHCVAHGHGQQADMTDELIAAFARLMRRG